jgi:hypothetical protein
MIQFACRDCGCPSITVDDILDEESIVSCQRCGKARGTWGSFKRFVSHATECPDDAADFGWLSELSAPRGAVLGRVWRAGASAAATL